MAKENPLLVTDRPHQLFADAPPTMPVAQVPTPVQAVAAAPMMPMTALGAAPPMAMNPLMTAMQPAGLLLWQPC